jgi:hypothetical protein
MQNELELLRGSTPPRPDALCRRLSRRIDSIWGFIAYGALWFFIANGIATAAMFAAIAMVDTPSSAAGRAFVLVMWAGAFIGAWVLFGWWVRRRLGPARRLFREGVLLDATVQAVQHLRIRGAPFTRATVGWPDGAAVMSVGGHPAAIVQGANVPVLVVPGYGYCATFPIAGRIVPASVQHRH